MIDDLLNYIWWLLIDIRFWVKDFFIYKVGVEGIDYFSCKNGGW